MDLHLTGAAPSTEERNAVDALLGPPASAWDGGDRADPRDLHTADGDAGARGERHLLLPALQAVQSRIGWISEGALDYICTRLNVPPAEAWGVATFYALIAVTPRPRRVLHVCDDIACRVRGATALCETLEAKVGPAMSHGPEGDHVTLDANRPIWMRSPCLGMCDRAPAAFVTEAGEAPFEALLASIEVGQATAILNPDNTAVGDSLLWSESREFTTRVVPQQGQPGLRLLARAGVVDPTDLDAYMRAGGYDGLARAIAMGPEKVVAQVTESGLTGRGGAAFPTGRKWAAVAAQPAQPHYIICNADESEPGTFKDRVLLEDDPFAIVEAMTIAAFATGCTRGFVYIRAEYPLGRARMRHAIERARAARLLGTRILNTDFAFDIEVRSGAGAYICGEETAIFNSIEGYRGEPRNKPPFPAQSGVFRKPTVVNNVETLANIPIIMRDGGAAFARTGSGQSTGTRIFCLSGHVTHPGVYEVPMGETLGQLLDRAGGVANGRPLQGILLGGAAGVFVRPDELGIPLTLEGARAHKATLGSGVIMVFDDTADLRDTVLRIAAFFRDESCGQCVPCRVGTVRQEEALHRIVRGRERGGMGTEVALLREVGLGMNDASICGLGQTAYAAVESAIHRLGVFGKVPS